MLSKINKKEFLWIKKVLFASILMTSSVFAIQPQVGKEKKATGIDLPASEWKLPDALKEDGYIDEAKMPKDQSMQKW